jgi:hypothetical protein
VGSADQVEAEAVEELSLGLQSEGIAGATVAWLPSLCGGVGVRPEEVTDESRGGPRDTVNAVEGIEVGGMPPWMQNIFTSTIAARGRQSKTEENASQTSAS